MNPHMIDDTTRHVDPMLRADERQLGTPGYTGHAWFWAHAYRHEMRPALPSVRKKIHHALLSSGLKLDGESPLHDRIITTISRHPSEPFPPAVPSPGDFLKSHLIVSTIG
jgi:hypothetical protein